MFETGSSLQIRNFYGATNDHFSNPRSVWGEEDRFVYSTSQDQTVVGWDVYNDKMLPVLKGHTRTVRDLCSRRGILASCSFDRSVKIWTSAQQENQVANVPEAPATSQGQPPATSGQYSSYRKALSDWE
mmetsp:Transcript_465/g.877  ORF Transcript_465/g.877 Transcript_465/m.877 type:complete len:129 (+) Transcript_465:73-459(+)